MTSHSVGTAHGAPPAGRLLIVEDHALMREALRMMTEASRQFSSIVEAGSLSAALAQLRSDPEPPRLVILDLGLPDADGYTALRLVLEHGAGAPVLVVAGRDDATAIDETFALGASGYVPKNSSARTLRTAIESVLDGELYVPPHVLPSRSHAGRPLHLATTPKIEAKLTRRQNDVLLQLARGVSNKEIAAELDMSLSTVRVHVSAVLKLLGAENRTQAAMSATALKLLGATDQN